METYFFAYKVEFVDDGDNKQKERTGLTFGTTYTEAMTRICDYYGNDNIISVNLQDWTETPIEIPEDILKKIEKEYL